MMAVGRSGGRSRSVTVASTSAGAIVVRTSVTGRLAAAMTSGSQPRAEVPSALRVVTEESDAGVARG